MRPSPTVTISDRTPRLLSSQVLHAIFTAQADAQPDALAVVFGREQITYGALEGRSTAVFRKIVDSLGLPSRGPPLAPAAAAGHLLLAD